MGYVGEARARGRKDGRKPAMSAKHIEMARLLYAEGKHRVDDSCSIVHCSRTTFYRSVLTLRVAL
jgi:DNA invertase Pin-like site-specific DNA recombinase